MTAPQGTGWPAGTGNGHVDQRRIAALEAEAAEPLTGLVHDAERKAQAEFEGADATDTVLFFGKRYRIAAKVGLMPLLKFANAAAKGSDSGDMEGLAAMYALLRGCLYRGHPACGTCAACAGDLHADPSVPGKPEACQYYDAGDWDAFERAAIEEDADDEDLFKVVAAVLEAVQARPTRRRSGSSPPGLPTSPNSKGSSSSPAGLVPVSDLAR